MTTTIVENDKEDKTDNTPEQSRWTAARAVRKYQKRSSTSRPFNVHTACREPIQMAQWNLLFSANNQVRLPPFPHVLTQDSDSLSHDQQWSVSATQSPDLRSRTLHLLDPS